MPVSILLSTKLHLAWISALLIAVGAIASGAAMNGPCSAYAEQLGIPAEEVNGECVLVAPRHDSEPPLIGAYRG